MKGSCAASCLGIMVQQQTWGAKIALRLLGTAEHQRQGYVTQVNILGTRLKLFQPICTPGGAVCHAWAKLVRSTLGDWGS